MIECVDAVIVDEAREISEQLDSDQQAEDARLRHATRARTKPHADGKVRSGFLIFQEFCSMQKILHSVNVTALICFHVAYKIHSQSQTQYI